MMSAPLAGEPLHVHAGRREDPLPHPLSPRLRVFPTQPCRKLDPSRSALDVTTMLLPHGLQMTSEIHLDHGGQHRQAVLVSLAAAHDDLVPREVEVPDPQAAALEQPKP